jgi:5-methylcytosine-specific restriction endonuclease McrA
LEDTYTRLACAGCGDRCVLTYCSNKCRSAVWRKKNPEAWAAHKQKEKEKNRPTHSAYFTGYCACGVAVGGRREKASCDVCAKHAKLMKARQESLRKAEALHRQDAKVVACEECSARFCPLYGASHSRLCVPCGNLRRRANKAAARVMRKAKIRAASVEWVNPLKVFDRDGWVCRLCGVATPKELRGSYDDAAPELDHIKPLSRGGEHSYANTQCLCRRCNAMKSDSDPGLFTSLLLRATPAPNQKSPV